MRIRQLSLINARIPLKKRIKHASHTRSENDTMLVRCELDDGSVGWGEGLPREYVTGETIDTVWQHLTSLNPIQLASPLNELPEVKELLGSLVFPQPVGTRDCFGNVARCALELSVFDAFAKAKAISLSELLLALPDAKEITSPPTAVQYSAAITAMRPMKTRIRALLVRAYRFAQCKVKVGVKGVDDEKLLQIVRRYLGPDIQIRIDANEAWKPSEVIPKLRVLEQFKISSLEQPLPHQNRDDLERIKADSPIPIMLDESLCSLSDAKYAIEKELCDIFNIRLSKCGGILASLQLALMAKRAGLQAQLGCQVGETGILSAAGRHFASMVDGLVAVEGSFDRLLVKEPLTTQDLTFGYRGLAPCINGPGLGVHVDDKAIRRVTQRVDVLRVSSQ